MSFSSASGGQMVDMNVTPLVDVMLVLLIIFMVAVPAISYTLQVDLPQADKTTNRAIPPSPIRIYVDAGGSVNWNGSPTTLRALEQKFEAAGALGLTRSGALDPDKQPGVEIAADREAEYQVVAQVLSRAKNANLVKISFVDPG